MRIKLHTIIFLFLGGFRTLAKDEGNQDAEKET
jgi:hypothetical protein